MVLLRVSSRSYNSLSLSLVSTVIVVVHIKLFPAHLPPPRPDYWMLGGRAMPAPGAPGVCALGALRANMDDGGAEEIGLYPLPGRPLTPGNMASNRCVVAQVEFKTHILKPAGLIFKGKGLKPVAFKLWVNIISTCTAPPLLRPRRQV
jgi:hypothetical protein